MAILIVDDAVTSRMLTRRFLTELGFENLHEARNGLEALNLLETLAPPDLLLLDWNMPEMDGLELLRALRANPHMPNIKVLMMTTETETAKILEALQAGADEYIMKPFSQDMLADKLNILGLGA